MKFLLDAQLPRRANDWLEPFGHDVVHTSDLPDGNRTSDAHLIEFAEQSGRVLITKDADFVDRYTLHRRPARLLLLSTGNISNADLETLMRTALASIVHQLNTHSFIELGRAGIIVRD